MASWCPTTPLEEEIVAFQPHYNFIYGDLSDQEMRRKEYQPRPRNHLEYLECNKKTSENEMLACGPLNIIRTVHEIAGTKEMGINASINDWDTRKNVERETIAMMRHFGMGPSVDLPLNKKYTLPTLPVQKRSYAMQNGQKQYPILFDDDSFKVVSTRMRNAELAKSLQETSNDMNSTNTEEDDIKPLPCDEEEEENETEEQAKQRELINFHEAFPTLDQKKKTKSPNGKQNKTTRNQEPENWRARNTPLSNHQCNTSFDRDPNNWRIPNSSLSNFIENNTSPARNSNNRRSKNSSSSSNLSFSNILNNSTNSDSSYQSLNNTTDSDDYASAKEYLENSNNDIKLVEKSIKASMDDRKSVNGNQINKNGLNKRLFTPKDVYNLKNQSNRK